MCDGRQDRKMQSQFFRDIDRYNKALKTYKKIDELKWANAEVKEGDRIISIKEAFEHYLPSEIEDRLILKEDFANRLDYSRGTLESMEKNIVHSYDGSIYCDVTFARTQKPVKWAKITKVAGHVAAAGTLVAAEILLYAKAGEEVFQMVNTYGVIVVAVIGAAIGLPNPSYPSYVVKDKINNKYLAAMETFDKIRKNVKERGIFSEVA